MQPDSGQCCRYLVKYLALMEKEGFRCVGLGQVKASHEFNTCHC